MTVSARSKRKSTQRVAKRDNSSMIWLIGGSIVLIGLIIFAVIINAGGTAASIAQPDVPEGWINGMSLGNPDAPILVETFEDFLCPHCREWTATAGKQLKEEYIQVEDSQVRWEFRPFPLDGFAPGSRMAAQAAHCAADQNFFWPYHDRLFAEQSRGQSAYQVEELIGYTGGIEGMGERQFTQCMGAMAHQNEILETSQEGVSRGVTGTPTVYVNGQKVNSDYASVKAEIDRLLATAGQ